MRPWTLARNHPFIGWCCEWGSCVPGIFDFTVRATDFAGNFTEQLCVLRVRLTRVPPVERVA
jgi:hypothetical protein